MDIIVKINKVGILLFLTSSLFCLFMAEGLLRLSGFIYEENRVRVYSNTDLGNSGYDAERDYEQYGKLKGNKIWAIGDSFTNAGNVESSESYPAFLYQNLLKSNYQATVLNLGQCEDPTWGVQERLKKILEGTEPSSYPDIVLVLTGVSDPFYYTLNGMKNLERQKQRISKFEMERKPFYKDFRLYKAFRHIKLELINRSLSNGAKTISAKTFKELAKTYKSIVRDIKNGTIKWDHYESKVELLLTNHREFVDGSSNEFKFQDKARFVFNTIIIPQVRVLTGRLNYNKALEIIMNFGEDFPNYFWSDDRNAPVTLHVMTQILMFQSKYTSSDLQKFLKRSTEQKIELRGSLLYTTARKLFQSKRDIEDVVKKSRVNSWKKMLELSRKYKFKLVVQTYASDFKKINLHLKQFSTQNKLLLIDQNKVFKEHVKKYGRDVLFADDNHFQPLGYRLQADSVFIALKKAGLLN